jgi:hypothetical protein
MKRVGILGLPGSGKTTLFEILMQGAGGSGTHAARREHVGIVRVPDPRVERLTALFNPRKTVHAQVEFVDSVAAGAASARAAAKGPDLFSSVRNCDALLALVRDFEDAASPSGVDAERDLGSLETELVINDLAIVENRVAKLAKEIRVGRKEGEREHALLLRCKQVLESGTPLRGESYEAEDSKRLRGFQLLTLKPLLVVYNQGDRGGHPPREAGAGTLAVALKAHLEREIVALPAEERDAFRAELMLAEDGLSLIIDSCYRLLGLISFFTVGPDEVRAWTLKQGGRAVEAAAEIHTDLAKGFIRAEVVGYPKLIEAGGWGEARERGWLRLEGKEYRVQDGDCLEIRFNP